ncbi:MAG: carboxypeptidase regulatory-like domain-containing protein [bacterium]|nr:carboxypeptidase regulatory-like domain-containing protein [bacterium]
MPSHLRILALLLLVVAAALLGYWFLGGGGDSVTPNGTAPERQSASTPSGQANEEPAPVTPASTPPGQGEGNEPPPPESRERVSVDNSQTDAPQGIKGRVLGPNGDPAGDVPVFLMPNMIDDPIKVFLTRRAGRVTPPVASGVTAADGTFALGAHEPGKTYDLRVVSELHPQLVHDGIELGEDDWYDTGDLRLQAGIRVTGRVIDEVTRAGIPGAVVYLEDARQTHRLLPTPGNERGSVATTDADGGFVFDNGAPQGLVTLTAEAEGFAAAILSNQTLPQSGSQVFTLEIARGRPLAGIVVDTNGDPLPGVQVTAQGLSVKAPQTDKITTGQDGTFHFPSLRDGPYELRTLSAGFGEAKSPPTLAGELDVKLVLQPRPWVKLKVFTARGKPIKAYRISLKRYFPNQPLSIGNVPEFSDRSINPSDYPSEFGGEWAVIRGLPPGEFVFQIRERNHAKSLSASFVVRADQEPAEVEATLTMGGTIVGTVVDDRGQPVRGAVVVTDMNNALAGSGGALLPFLKQMIPAQHSKAQVRTDKLGRFKLTKLAFAEYMVRTSHPDFCVGKAMDISIREANQTIDLGAIELVRGTTIEGFTTIAGAAAGQIKVVLSSNTEPVGEPHKDRRLDPRAIFAATAISANDGRYRLLERVPPGEYKIHAQRPGESSNLFNALFDIRETERTITIRAGQDHLKLDFALPVR